MLKPMVHSSNRLALSKQLTAKFVKERLSMLNAKDTYALRKEFKEWLEIDEDHQDPIWSIPDLTNDALRSFFLRAINKISNT